MNTFLKKAALAAALATASLSAHAAEAEIAVWADVDPTLALLKADGTPLDASIKLAHNASTGVLVPDSQLVRIHSNDTTKDLEVRLGADPVLLPEAGGKGVPVPLAVSLNGQSLSTTSVDFEASKLFDGALPNRSIPMELRIGQGNTTAIAEAGQYKGIVTIALKQKP
jgi:hypothetical protein